MVTADYWNKRRQEQTKNWFHDMIHDRLIDDFFSKPEKRDKVKELEHILLNGEMTITAAVNQLFAKNK